MFAVTAAASTLLHPFGARQRQRRFTHNSRDRLEPLRTQSRRRAQAALAALWMYTGEMFELAEVGAAPNFATLRAAWDETVDRLLAEARLKRPEDGWMQSGGRRGRHSEHLGYILAELQFLQRAYPGATW